MSTYSLQQQVFVLSMIASAGAGDTGTAPVIESEVKAAIQQFLSNPAVLPYMGSWSIAWGPVVYEIPSVQVAANAMFVAQGTDGTGNPVYVVAIAATNGNSRYDLLTEDADITLRPWPYPLPTGTQAPLITEGTVDGVNALRAAQDPATGLTLQAFLTQVSDPAEAMLVFTGHSLGGALSPALALALFAAPGGGTLDPAEWGAVYLYPTAGPTVGGAPYASFWNAVFPPAQDASGEQWNLLVWNTLDVIPHAWALLGELNTLYPASDITWTPCLTHIQNGLLAKVGRAGGTFVQPASDPLPGTFSAWTGASSSSPMVTYFLIEMLYQHVWAYFDLLHVPEMRQFFPGVINPTANPTAPPPVTGLCTAIVDVYCLRNRTSKGQCGASSTSVVREERGEVQTPAAD